MRRFTEFLSGSAAVLFQVALTGWMFALSRINFDFVAMELNYVLLSAVILASFYINSIIMRRGLKVPLFVLLQIVFIAVGIFTFVKTTFIEPYELRTIIINCIIYCLGFAVAVYLSWSPTDQHGILLRFDALAIMTVIIMVLDHIMDLPGAKGCLSMCLVTLCVTVIAAVSMRSGALMGRGAAVEGNGALGRILLIIVAAIMGALALLVIIFAGGEFKSFSEFLLNVITAILNALKTAFLWVYGLLERFLTWLTQFMDDTPMESIGEMAGGAVVGDVAMEEDVSLPKWIYAIPIAIIVGALAYMVFKLRKYKAVKISSRRHVVTKVQRESGLAEALKALWAKIKAEVLFRFNCLRYRRSCAAVLVCCQKKCPEELMRMVGESGESFILRLGKTVGGEGEKYLAILAEKLQQSFYSPQKAMLTKEEYKAIKKLKFKVEK
ncbi:MAG: hypothetical protein IKV79_08870 [Oscillospiraceae bacterium]|nr:hypothetical protein [Oscillospiraceae bacterium]